MTVQEAKGFIQGKIDCMDRCDVFDCKHTDECESCNYCYSQGNFGEQKNALKFAIESMKEIEQYRALGTVEELKEAREFKKYFDELYGEGLEIANWHKNGDLEPFDSFYESALEWGEEDD